MITVRAAQDRGHANHGWLDSHHTFSFASYYDPKHMGFSHLRVINDDRVQGGMGFGTHPHKNMEIISYVLSGALQHKDSMGTGSIIQAGDVQLMSAGRGVTHSEFNASPDETVHFLQIWIMPNQANTTPSYQQRSFEPAERQDRWRLLVSPEGEDDSLRILQEMKLYGGVLTPGASLRYETRPGRRYWLHVAQGQATLNGEHALGAGDGVAIEATPQLELQSAQGAELLLFELT